MRFFWILLKKYFVCKSCLSCKVVNLDHYPLLEVWATLGLFGHHPPSTLDSIIVPYGHKYQPLCKHIIPRVLIFMLYHLFMSCFCESVLSLIILSDNSDDKENVEMLIVITKESNQRHELKPHAFLTAGQVQL